MKTKTVAVSAVVGVLVLALWYMFLVKPMRSQASKVHKDVVSAQKDQLALKAQLAAISDKTHIAQTKAQLAKLQAAIPPQPQLAAFLRSANAIASTAGVDWQTITPSPPAQTAGTDTITLGITVQGTQPEVHQYLESLQALPRLVIVDGTSLGPGTATTGTPAPKNPNVIGGDQSQPVALQITARLFTSPDATTATGAAGSTGTGTTGSGTASTPVQTPVTNAAGVSNS